jgi:hypothetical protein
VNDGPHGGGIVVEAGGSFVVLGLLQASSIDPSGNGGFINVQADQGITLGIGGQAVALAGAVADLGGEVALVSTGGSVGLGGEIHVTGGSYSPGAVTVTAATLVNVAGLIGAAGSCGAAGECSLAGVVRITAGFDLMLQSNIDVAAAEGGVSSADGTGGQVTLDAGADLFFLGGIMNLMGNAPGRGGTFRARLDGDYVQSPGTAIDVSGASDGAGGGTIDIDAGEAVLVEGGLSAEGGSEGDGGTTRIAAELEVSIAGKLSASANYPTGGIEVVSRTSFISAGGNLSAAGRGPFGTGGAIGLYSVTGIDIDAVLDASGEGAEGLGGTVRLDTFGPLGASPGTSILAGGDPSDPELGLGGLADLVACSIVIEEGDVAATGGPGAGGAIHLAASDSMTIAAAVSAEDGGLIQVRHPPGAPPDLSGSTITPDPLVSPSEVLTPCFALPGQTFSRGDCNTRDGVNISDPINLLNSLFLGTPERLPCEKACDANDDGLINISDPIKLLNALFVSQGEVLPPPLFCGLDETADTLTCEEFAACP